MGAAIAGCAYLWLSLLCLPPVYGQSYHVSSIYSEVDTNGQPVRHDTESERTGVHIDLFETDSFGTTVDAAFEHACVRAGCVPYRKHCASAMSCEYTIPAPHIVRFRVTAQSPQRLRHALRQITYRAGGVEVPLSLLTAESPGEIRIGCPRLAPPIARAQVTTQLQGCPAL